MRLSVVGVTKLPVPDSVKTEQIMEGVRCAVTKQICGYFPKIMFNVGLNLFEDLFECCPNCCHNEIREVIKLIATMVTDL